MIRADPAQLEQVVLNLVGNACDAMPGGGKIVVSTENASVDKDYCASMPKARIGTFVRLSITDTGIGMDQDTLKQIFTPFFTTKGTKGTGLGLSTVYGIVEQHNGWIDVYSKHGEGSTFSLYFQALSL